MLYMSMYHQSVNTFVGAAVVQSVSYIIECILSSLLYNLSISFSKAFFISWQLLLFKGRHRKTVESRPGWQYSSWIQNVMNMYPKSSNDVSVETSPENTWYHDMKPNTSGLIHICALHKELKNCILHGLHTGWPNRFGVKLGDFILHQFCYLAKVSIIKCS